MARALAKKPETSVTLLEAAKKVLRQNGYAGLSTRDVAAAAGVPLSQIHYHFGSKQGMVLALFEYLNAQLLDRQNALFDDTDAQAFGAMGPGLRLSRRRHRLGLRARAAGADGGKLGRCRGRQSRPRRPDHLVRSPHRARAQGRAASWGASVRSRPRRSPHSSAARSWARKASICSAARRRACRCARRCGASAISFALRKLHPRRGDVMRAKLPSKDGFVERDGVKIHYEVYGDGPETMVFLPPWSIVHSRVYKAQLPYFSERFRCITFDPRGNGKSDQPTEAAAYSLDNYVADALAVMDATDAGKAILVGLSLGGMHACVLAAHHPERVKAAILAGTAATVGPGYPYLTPTAFHGQARAVRGLGQVQSRLLAGGLSGFRRAFRPQHLLRAALDQADRGRHRVGRRNDRVPCWSRRWRRARSRRHSTSARRMYRKIRCPLLMIHGDNDQIQPYARAQVVAELTGAELFTIPGGGHNPLGRFPAKCNDLINDFLDRRLGIPAPGKKRTAALGQDQEGALSLLADRPRARPARHRHHARAAQAAPRPAGRLAGAGPGDAAARRLRRAHPSAERAARQRDAAHRARVGRARPQLPSRPSAAWTRC